MSKPCTWCNTLRTVLSDTAQGLFLVTHSGLAMVGLGVAAFVLALWVKPDWLHASEERLFDWLRERQVLVSWLPENAAERATALNVQDLPPRQAAVATWLARKYRVAPEPVAALVAEAYVLAKKYKLEPHLILGVMAIESNFHPYIQSQAGAQGLMQVMTGIHAKRYEAYGGNLTAFDPITNMRVGVAVLWDAIKLKGGSVDDGLKFYLGGDAVFEDGGYVAKVRAEQARLDQVAAGVNVPLQ
ncbi:transglycosylase SLT domain-containing protein [Limnohabitans lacus]|jgi:soluble lytic murein transglycosylase-like protein|uniref:Transglycosylase SLT domain-containing protein n=1 Tax=Limnohabitans lacus TaxID=3045173 RepID=A0ABT6X3X3_9BURK|nr:transglycosylase SLT domain-containing protein [Limnohabitans sp. HM2-2]MDI9232823.1 transglycosylase SLT domain-containing protein [Limnohabitans sp. HM2-2]